MDCGKNVDWLEQGPTSSRQVTAPKPLVDRKETDVMKPNLSAFASLSL